MLSNSAIVRLQAADGSPANAGFFALVAPAVAAAGLDGRVSFEVAPANHFHGDGYDLVAMFDCLHDPARAPPTPAVSRYVHARPTRA